MRNIKRILAITAVLSAINIISVRLIFSQEEREYRKFSLDKASCDTGIYYKSTPQGLTIGVSAIATGKGAEFRKWNVSEIRLNIGKERFMPDKEGKFYVSEESFFRVPGAVVFAAIGAFAPYGGSDLESGISKTGAAVGLGLIALQAKGQITGKRCVFYIPKDTAERIREGRDDIEIVIENEGQHLKETIKIGLIHKAGFEKKQGL